MPGVAPETSIHDLAPVGGVRLETGQLEISMDSKRKPMTHTTRPGDVPSHQAGRSAPCWAAKSTWEMTHMEQALQQEDLEEAEPPEGAAPLLAHGLVARILPLP